MKFKRGKISTRREFRAANFPRGENFLRGEISRGEIFRDEITGTAGVICNFATENYRARLKLILPVSCWFLDRDGYERLLS